MVGIVHVFPDHVDQCEVETWAAEIRGVAGIAEDDLLTGPEIAVRVVGPENVLLCAGKVGARLEGRTIIVPEKHEDVSHAFAHELAELALRDWARFGGPPREKERAANMIAAATLAPPGPLARALRHFRERVDVVARAFAMSHTVMHLRVLEMRGSEGAVVVRRGGDMMVRNPRQVPWDDPAVLAFAFGNSRRHRGLTRTPVRGLPFERGRVALLAG